MAPPVFSTANCYKGFSGGAQTAPLGLSFGGGNIDKNCAALMTAQNLYAMGSRLAACKVIITTKAAKEGHVTMEDCMTVPMVAPRIEHQTRVPETLAPIVVAPVVITAPAPQVLFVPEYHQTITVTPPVKKRIVHAGSIPPSLLTPIPTH